MISLTRYQRQSGFANMTISILRHAGTLVLASAALLSLSACTVARETSSVTMSGVAVTEVKVSEAVSVDGSKESYIESVFSGVRYPRDLAPTQDDQANNLIQANIYRVKDGRVIDKWTMFLSPLNRSTTEITSPISAADATKPRDPKRISSLFDVRAEQGSDGYGYFDLTYQLAYADGMAVTEMKGRQSFMLQAGKSLVMVNGFTSGIEEPVVVDDKSGDVTLQREGDYTAIVVKALSVQNREVLEAKAAAVEGTAKVMQALEQVARNKAELASKVEFVRMPSLSGGDMLLPKTK